MRLACTVLGLLLLPSLAAAEMPVPTMKAKEIILPQQEEESVTSSSILKNLAGRFWLEYREDELGRRKRGKVKIKIELYEFPRGDDGTRHRLDIKPQIGDEPGLTIIYRF